MDPVRFFASSRVLIVAGKGGVGKTTVAATIATAASECGLSVLLVEVAGRSAAAPMLGAGPQGYAETILVPAGRDRAAAAAGARPEPAHTAHPEPADSASPEPAHTAHPEPGDETAADSPEAAQQAVARGEIRGRSITADEALIEWLSKHGFERIVRRMARSGVLEVVATATPGIKDLLVLGRIKALEAERAADLIVVDAPAAGHAVGLLRSPIGVRDAARTGTLHRQATEALELIRDPARCRVMLVTIAEETPVNELIETSFAVEDEVGVSLGPVVVNGLLPELAGLDGQDGLLPELAGLDGHDGLSRALPEPLEQAGADDAEIADMAAAAALRLGRQRLQAEHLARLDEELPLPQLRLPHLFTPQIGPSEITALAAALSAEIAGLAP